MCGIAGIFSQRVLDQQAVGIVTKMGEIQRHRGPDDQGIMVKPKCVLGHRRLSIIDLSSDGHQPFASDDGRYWMVYNGEVYNYIELRSELEKAGWKFRTKTDTEVLLKAFLAYGKDCLSKLNGMFAFAVYDSVEETLFLARDRFGIKPLYYIFQEGSFIFASELKAFKAIPGLKLTVNELSIFDYFLFNRKNLFDECFFKEISVFPKGHYGVVKKNELELNQWWQAGQYLGKNTELSIDEVSRLVEEILTSAVRLRMRSDVTVGSCLSGGLDSSILLGILFQKKLIQNNYATFTASFPGEPIDEIQYIDDLKQKYFFKNHRAFPDSNRAFKQLTDFVFTQDEPTLGPTYFAQYEVMRLARDNGVTVLLDGQGGDEDFAGYPYMNGYYLYGLLRQGRALRWIKELGSTILGQQDKMAYETFLFRVLPGALQKKVLQSRVPYFRDEFFQKYLNQSIVYNKFLTANNLNEFLARHFEFKLEHLLHSEDRSSMAFSIEARVPYLDYRLVEFLLGVNEEYKVGRGQMKQLQKRALGQYTSEMILSRRDKIGFDTPTDKWMSSESWQKLAKSSYDDVLSRWPGIFNRSERIFNDPLNVWKVIQLSTWAKIFLD